MWGPRGGFLRHAHAPLDACGGGHFQVVVGATGSREGVLWGSLNGRIHSCLSCRKDSVLDTGIRLGGGQDGSGEHRLQEEAWEDVRGHWLE